MSVSASPINAASITVSWSLTNPSSAQEIDYSVSGPGMTTVTGIIYPGLTVTGSATASGLTPNTSYTYTASGTYIGGGSWSGGSGVASTQKAGYLTVTAVSFSGSGTSGSLSWVTGSSDSSYPSVLNTGTTVSQSPGGTLSGSSAPISVSGLTSGTTYTWTVTTTYFSNGYSGSSSGSTSYTASSTPTYPPSWTDSTLAAFVYNTVYSDGVAASNMSYSGSYSVSAGTLPTGISLNTSTGAVTGTPSVSGQSYSFTLKATNTYGNTTRAFSGTVSAAASVPTWTDNVLAPFVVNKAYSDSVTAKDANTSITVSGTLPNGITTSTSSTSTTRTMTFSGTPTGAAYPYNFTVTATGTGGIITQNYTGNVQGMISVFDGSVWVTKPIKVRGASTWGTGTVYIYNGSSWVPSN